MKLKSVELEQNLFTSQDSFKFQEILCNMKTEIKLEDGGETLECEPCVPEYLELMMKPENEDEIDQIV